MTKKLTVLPVLLIMVLLVPVVIQAGWWGNLWQKSKIKWIRPPLTSPAPTGQTSGRIQDAKVVCSTGPAVAIEEAKAANKERFAASIAQIKKELGIAVVYQGFPKTSSESDWRAYLDAAKEARVKLAVTFADSPPTVVGNGVDLGISGEFLEVMKDHPALYAILLIDEPFHRKHGWKITADKLKEMYRQAKGIAPNVAVIVQFSREVQKMEEDGNTQYQFDAGMCDICQISALEFRNYGQGNKFYKEDLVKNHSVSRKVIGREAPGTPVHSSAQSFGNKLGKSSYYFPSLAEYREMLDLLLSPDLAKHGKLSGIYFQTWTAEKTAVRAQQQNLSSPQSTGYREAVKVLCR